MRGSKGGDCHSSSGSGGSCCSSGSGCSSCAGGALHSSTGHALRALRALRLGLEMRHAGYNVFVTGASGTGRLTTIKRLLGERDCQVKVRRVPATRVAGADADPIVVQQPERLRRASGSQRHRLSLHRDRRIQVVRVARLCVARL